MLIAATIAVLAILFGAPQNDLLILKMDKQIKKYVSDKSRKKYLLTQIKAVKKLQQIYQKETKKHTADLKQLVDDQTTDKVAFDAFHKSLLEYEVSVNKKFIPNRINVQDALTDEEWKQILDSSEKAFKKSQKNNQKTLVKLKKDLAKSNVRIQSHFDDPGKKDKAGVFMDDFSSILYDFAVELLNYNQFEEDVLASKHATEAALTGVVEESNRKWIGMLDAFSKLHGQLSELATEEEWKSISNELKKKLA